MGRRRSKADTWREGMGFWLIVLLICMVAGVISYQAGRNWVGRHLAEVNLRANQPELPSAGETDTEVVGLDELDTSTPPLTPTVTITDREPSEAEKVEVERANLDRQAQDEAEEGASDTAPHGEAEPDAEVSEGGYVVTAGSYADQDNAQRAIQRLTEKGYRPFISEVDKEGITYQRVNVAVFDDRGQAEQLRDELKKQGFVSGVMPR